MIEFKNVTVRYGSRTVLENVSFSAEDGNVLVVLGRNGAGKSSLFRCAAGIEKYTGEILINGISSRSLSNRQRALQLAYMPQNLPETEMTVYELVLCGRAPHAGTILGVGREDERMVQNLLKKTELWEYGSRPVHTLSGGERRRAYLAMAAAQNTQVILLDEPTANLDTDYRQMVYGFISEAKDAGKTVVVVMHHIAEACKLADRICVLNEKKVLFCGNTAEFEQQNIRSRLSFLREEQAPTKKYCYFENN